MQYMYLVAGNSANFLRKFTNSGLLQRRNPCRVKSRELACAERNMLLTASSCESGWGWGRLETGAKALGLKNWTEIRDKSHTMS